MKKRRQGRAFNAPGENEGFMDYMLRRATQGGYDKRDEQSYDRADEEDSSDDNQSSNSSKTKKPKSATKTKTNASKKTPNSTASKVASSDVTTNDNFSVISTIQNMSSVLGIKLDDISYGIKESNQKLGSINKYSEDSSIWLAEIYDLLDTSENKDRKNKKSDAEVLSTEAINGMNPTEEGGSGGSLLGAGGALAAGALATRVAGGALAGEAAGGALAGEAAGGALAGEAAAGGGALVAAAPLAGAALAVGGTIAVPMIAQKLAERDKEEILNSRGQIIPSDPQAIQDIKDALNYQIKQNADIADPTQNYDDLFLSLKSSISDVVGPLSSAGKISEMAINTIILQKAREIMANAGKKDVHLSEDFDRSIQYIDAIPLDSRNERPAGMGGHHPDSGTDSDGARPDATKEPDANNNVDNSSLYEKNSMSNKQDLIDDFAIRMGLSGTDHTSRMQGGVPVEIDGMPVPQNLYTPEQLKNINAARQIDSRNERPQDNVDQAAITPSSDISSTSTYREPRMVNHWDTQQRKVDSILSQYGFPPQNGMQFDNNATQTTASPVSNYSSSNPNPETESSESGVGDISALGVPGGGGARPPYPLTEADLSPDVVNVIAGEVSATNQEGVDAVINTMMNRVGTGGAWGPDGNLQQVATAPGQFAGYRRASESEAEFIRGRIKAIASGSVPDNTNGADSYRASSYVFGEGAGKTFAKLAASQGNVNIGGNIFAKDPKGPVGAYASPSSPGSKAATMMASAAPTPSTGRSTAAPSAGASGGSVAQSVASIGKLAGNLIGNLSKSTSMKSATPQVAAASSGGSGGALASTGSLGGGSSKLPTGGSSNPLPAIDNMFAKLFDESAMFG